MALSKPKQLVVDEPKVFVVGAMQHLPRGLDEFLTSEGHGGWTTSAGQSNEILPEVAGRLCYMSFGGGRDHAEYVENIKRDRHGSVLEHAVLAIIITGVSRSFTHELVRHRAGWGYSQLSQRFVEEGNCQFVSPWIVRQYPGLLALWTTYVEATLRWYVALREALERNVEPPAGSDQPWSMKIRTKLRKVINGAARSILPNATETKIYCTVNARALRHFLEMRGSLAADHEIRAVALKVYRAAHEFMPDILADFEVREDDDGSEYLVNEFPKV